MSVDGVEVEGGSENGSSSGASESKSPSSAGKSAGSGGGLAVEDDEPDPAAQNASGAKEQKLMGELLAELKKEDPDAGVVRAACVACGVPKEHRPRIWMVRRSGPP